MHTFALVLLRHFPVRHFPVLQIPVLQIQLSPAGRLFHKLAQETRKHFSELDPQMRCDVAGGIWGRTQVGTSYSCSEVVSCWYRDSRFELASKSQRRYLSYFSMTSPCLNLVIIFYQTQSYHPIILDSDLMKNFQDVILALNDTVHLCSTHWATIRTEYTMIRHIT